MMVGAFDGFLRSYYGLLFCGRLLGPCIHCLSISALVDHISIVKLAVQLAFLILLATFVVVAPYTNALPRVRTLAHKGLR